jgi:predicted acetyltransferase
MLEMSSTIASRESIVRSAGSVSPTLRHAPAARSGTSQDASPPQSARAGDHHAIHRLLVSTQHTPSPAEFQAQLEEPSYDPAHRLIVKLQSQVVAHARIAGREMYLGPKLLPTLCVHDLVVAPEYRRRGWGTRLLEAIDQRLASQAAVVAILQTPVPRFFQERGWHVCWRHSYSLANPREILRWLGERSDRERPRLQPPPPSLHVRVWRHVELASLTSLYARHASGTFGPLQRSDAYWRWLISRRGYDRILIAVEGDEKNALHDDRCILGYAVIQRERILELMADQPCAAEALLARACRDAIEQDLSLVRLDAPPDQRLHEIFVASGGQRCYHEAENGSVFMVRTPRLQPLLDVLAIRTAERVRQAGLELPFELGLAVAGERNLLSVRRRKIHWVSGRLGRSYLECDRSALVQMVLGHLDVPAALATGRLVASTRIAGEIAAVLFPQVPCWRPPWDNAPA